MLLERMARVRCLLEANNTTEQYDRQLAYRTDKHLTISHSALGLPTTKLYPPIN